MTNEELKQLFIKEVHAAARARYAVDVFADMVRTMALALESPLTLGYYLHCMPMRRGAA